MSILKYIGTLVSGVVLHAILIPAGFIACLFVFGKLGSDVAYIIGGWYLPFFVSGVILGKTKGIVAPRVTAPASATFVFLYFFGVMNDGNHEFNEYALWLLPVVALSYLGALWGTCLAREKVNQMIRIPND